MWRLYLKQAAYLRYRKLQLGDRASHRQRNDLLNQNNDGSGNTNDREKNLSASMCCCWAIPNDHPSIHHEQRWLGATTGIGPDHA
jgi:hypothetical protein